MGEKGRQRPAWLIIVVSVSLFYCLAIIPALALAEGNEELGNTLLVMSIVGLGCGLVVGLVIVVSRFILRRVRKR